MHGVLCVNVLKMVNWQFIIKYVFCRNMISLCRDKDHFYMELKEICRDIVIDVATMQSETYKICCNINKLLSQQTFGTPRPSIGRKLNFGSKAYLMS